ncbi:hypothetical protein [Nocardia sp. CA-290969]|uniref:hypothetical protein n=1 Tax=Nocardia sp. CA-290969 TaxID=3239986 RepID=UPI003D94C4A8
MREYASPDELLGELQQVDVTPLVLRLNEGALERLGSGDLTISEMMVAAEWLGMEKPEDIFRGM